MAAPLFASPPLTRVLYYSLGLGPFFVVVVVACVCVHVGLPHTPDLCRSPPLTPFGFLCLPLSTLDSAVSAVVSSEMLY